MTKKNLRLGFDITMDKGATWRPLKIQFWNQESDFAKSQPSQPLTYMADALVGLSMVKLNHYIKSPIATPHLDYSFAADAWKSLDPHAELYERSLPRVRALQSKIALVNPEVCSEFETKFNNLFETVLKPGGLDLTALWPLLDSFTWFENKMGHPLLYNLGLNFSKPFIEKLQVLFSCLYHLRSIVAVDHNAHVEDTSHEGLTVDAITDYLPRAEYVVNDALLYWNFKNLTNSFRSSPNCSPQVEKQLLKPLEKNFQKYSHNAIHLVENLPLDFMTSLNTIELEEAFYLVQMDWLLGSPAGLLFKIREEVFALQSGYEKIFWKDVEPPSHSKAVNLQLCCEISPQMVYGSKIA